MQGPAGDRTQARNLPPPPARLPDRPEQYGVYRGQVANIIDLGCFVELHGFPSRQEGLVHVSNISKTRWGAPHGARRTSAHARLRRPASQQLASCCTSLPCAACRECDCVPACRRVGNAREAVKRGQQVWVKVLSVAAGRLSLSMRDVDQDTGKDLLPGARAGGGQEQRAGPSGLQGLSGIRVQVSAQSAGWCMDPPAVSPEQLELSVACSLGSWGAALPGPGDQRISHCLSMLRREPWAPRASPTHLSVLPVELHNS